MCYLNFYKDLHFQMKKKTSSIDIISHTKNLQKRKIKKTILKISTYFTAERKSKSFAFSRTRTQHIYFIMKTVFLVKIKLFFS